MDLKTEIELMERLIALTREWKDLMERCAEIQRGMVLYYQPKPWHIRPLAPWQQYFDPPVITSGGTSDFTGCARIQPVITSGN